MLSAKFLACTAVENVAAFFNFGAERLGRDEQLVLIVGRSDQFTEIPKLAIRSSGSERQLERPTLGHFCRLRPSLRMAGSVKIGHRERLTLVSCAQYARSQARP
jgi:hypothetical protein